MKKEQIEEERNFVIHLPIKSKRHYCKTNISHKTFPSGLTNMKINSNTRFISFAEERTKIKVKKKKKNHICYLEFHFLCHQITVMNWIRILPARNANTRFFGASRTDIEA